MVKVILRRLFLRIFFALGILLLIFVFHYGQDLPGAENTEPSPPFALAEFRYIPPIAREERIIEFGG